MSLAVVLVLDKFNYIPHCMKTRYKTSFVTLVAIDVIVATALLCFGAFGATAALSFTLPVAYSLIGIGVLYTLVEIAIVGIGICLGKRSNDQKQS